MITHKCQATSCERIIPVSLLMCKRHWMLVPRNIQNKILSTYREGQEFFVGTDRGPSPRYMEAYHEAVAAVAKAERRTLR